MKRIAMSFTLALIGLTISGHAQDMNTSKPQTQIRPQAALNVKLLQKQVEILKGNNNLSSLKGKIQGGVDSGGGGVYITSDAKVCFLDLVKTPTKIILSPSKEKGFSDLIKVMNTISGFKNTTYLPTAHDNEISVTSYEKILTSLKSLTFYLVPGPLPELNDKGTILIKKEFDGRIQRLALQNIRENIVLVDRDLYKRMSENSEIDVAAFFMHEALIRVYHDNEIYKPLVTTELLISALDKLHIS